MAFVTRLHLYRYIPFTINITWEYSFLTEKENNNPHSSVIYKIDFWLNLRYHETWIYSYVHISNPRQWLKLLKWTQSALRHCEKDPLIIIYISSFVWDKNLWNAMLLLNNFLRCDDHDSINLECMCGNTFDKTTVSQENYDDYTVHSLATFLINQ